ncbi:MAG: UDP-N-acetylglucosamine 1-carboxyvinyltransferase [Ruminococcus sp.]|nr:UDP-N-acetylglucosamine 1-carboxyvinyltransferase [Ruminococcus sp.]
MSKLIIKGKQRLGGKVSVQGAKNSALPILAATVLTRGESLIFNCPMLSDVEASVRILRYLGCVVSREGSTLVINSDGVCRSDIPDGLMRKMRSSIVFLGAVLARTGSARLSFPGGCEIGPRPIDIHLCALREMGAVIKEKHGYLDCTAPDGLKGCKLSLSFPSVGATEDIMLAATLAHGTTTITNAAREPEISDLAEYLNKCGAKIYGAGEGVVVIDGVDSLNGACHTIIPDRIAAATLMSCAAVTGSRIALTDVIGSQLASVIPVFEEAGCTVLCKNGEIDFRAPQRLDSMRIIRTMPYPGFPTDAQAPLMAAACVAKGTTVFIENIFENRYRHTSELIRMGANIRTEGKFAVVEGVDALYGAAVEATDLRGAASLVAAGLCAEQKTEISGIKYLERGYENLELTLGSLGADIKKI